MELKQRLHLDVSCLEYAKVLKVNSWAPHRIGCSVPTSQNHYLAVSYSLCSMTLDLSFKALQTGRRTPIL